MDLPGHQLPAAVEEPLHNLPGGPKRLGVWNIDSSFVAVIGFRSWSWTFNRPKLGMPYSTAWLRDIDRYPGTENCYHQGQDR